MDFFTKEFKDGKDIALLLLRIVFGFVLIYGHAFDKFAVIFSGQEIQFGDPIGIGMHLSFYLAAFAEGICSLLLIFGFYTRFASIVLTFNFLVIFYLHSIILSDSFDVLEIRIFYLFVYIAFIIAGAGKYSLDHKYFNKTA